MILVLSSILRIWPHKIEMNKPCLNWRWRDCTFNKIRLELKLSPKFPYGQRVSLKNWRRRRELPKKEAAVILAFAKTVISELRRLLFIFPLFKKYEIKKNPWVPWPLKWRAIFLCGNGSAHLDRSNYIVLH